MDIVLIHRIILCVLTAVSFALNTLLIAVIFHKQCRLVGNYRYLLVSFAILDLTTSFLGLITHPVVIVSEYGLLSVSMNLMDQSGFIENLGTRIFNLTFYEPFLLLTFHFVYRYRALIAPENTASKFRKGFALAILVFLVYTCLAAIPAHLASMDPTKNRRFFVNASEYTSTYLQRRDAIPLAMLYFHDPVHRSHFDQTTLILLIVSGTVVSIPLFVNVILVYKIRSAVGNKSDNRWAVDPRVQTLQIQLNRALMLQFFIPAIFYMIPFIVVLGMPLTGINIGYAVNFIFLAPSMYTIIDPIMLIATVSRFRDVIAHWCSLQDRRAARNERNERERSAAYRSQVQSRMTSSSGNMQMVTI